MTTTVKPTVAVIDDDCRILESLDDLLDCAGFGVRLFASAGDFLCSAAVSEVDCVISDIAMPGLDGFVLQQMIREARPTLPVILMTGRHELAVAGNESERGGRVLFGKPFDRERLLAAIEFELREAAGRQ